MQSEPKLVRRAFECPRPLLPRGILTEPLKEAKKISPTGVVFVFEVVGTASRVSRGVVIRVCSASKEDGPRDGPWGAVLRLDNDEPRGESEVQRAGFQNLCTSL